MKKVQEMLLACLIYKASSLYEYVIIDIIDSNSTNHLDCRRNLSRKPIRNGFFTTTADSTGTRAAKSDVISPNANNSIPG